MRAQGASGKRFGETMVQAVEAVICTFAIVWGFQLAHKPGAIWALVSAVIVLRPGFEDSLRASEVRIAANMVGALVGVVVSVAARAAGPLQIAVALAVVILICHWPPLENGVRSACAGVVIVMMHEGSVTHMGFERLAAVLVGCLTAMVVGFLGDKLWRRSFGLGRR